MCGFFFVSGCFFRGADMSFLSFLYKKVRGLLVPYLLIGSACYVVGEAYRASQTEGWGYLHWKAYGRYFLLFGSYYWFVCCLFVAQLIQYALVHLSRGRDAVLLCMAAVVSLAILCFLVYCRKVTLPWYVHIACVMQWPLNAGYVLMKRRLISLFSHGWVALLSAAVYLWVWGYACYVLRMPAISDVFGAYHHIGVYLLLAHAGVFCCICISQLVAAFPFIILIGRCTLCIYFVHFAVSWLFRDVVGMWYESLCRITAMTQLIPLQNAVTGSLSVCVGLVCGIILTQMVRRWAPWVMGKSYAKKNGSA